LNRANKATRESAARSPGTVRMRIAAIGVIVVVMGLALIGAGASGLLARATTFETFDQHSAGEFVSGEIVLNTTSVVDVRSPAGDGGLIPASDIVTVTSSNVGSFEVPYKASAGATDVYNSLSKGGYYYVAFSQTPPSTVIVVADAARQAETAHYWLVALAGFVLIAVGIGVAALVAASKSRR
jgi:hypothetical protein